MKTFLLIVAGFFGLYNGTLTPTPPTHTTPAHITVNATSSATTTVSKVQKSKSAIAVTNTKIIDNSISPQNFFNTPAIEPVAGVTTTTIAKANPPAISALKSTNQGLPAVSASALAYQQAEENQRQAQIQLGLENDERIKKQEQNKVSQIVPDTVPISTPSTSSGVLSGQVVLTPTGCDYYAVYDSSGFYDILEWYSGTVPYENNILIGSNLHHYGFSDFYDYTKDANTHAWVEDWDLSVTNAAQKLIDKCPQSYPKTSTYDDIYTPTYTPTYYDEPVYTPTTYYTNTYGNTIESPDSNSVGASAICNDGTYSHSQSRSGTCSHHGGVSSW